MNPPVVAIVDDEEPLRDSISLMLQLRGHVTKVFESATEMLEWITPATKAVVICDIRMPVMNGLDLISSMKARFCAQPVIVITGHGDVPLAVRAMKLGASEFFEKPFNAVELAGTVARLSAMLESSLAATARQAEIERRLSVLSARESAVLAWLVEGQPNKIIAAALSISPRTVEVHRSNILTKMQVKNTPELIRLVLGFEREKASAHHKSE